MTLIIAHRGASGDVPFGNTLLAFEKAHEAGAPMLELDVRQTQDKVWVCFHDDSFQGTALASMSYDQLIQRTSPIGLEVPTLKTILKWSKGKIRLDIELKEQGYEPRLLAGIMAELEPTDFVITSFHDASLRLIKQINPDIKVGLLVGKEAPQSPQTRMQELFPGKRLKRCRADFIAPHYRLLTLGFIQRMKTLQMPVFVWTVNDAMMIEKFKKIGVAGIITDHPRLALQT